MPSPFERYAGARHTRSQEECAIASRVRGCRFGPASERKSRNGKVGEGQKVQPLSRVRQPLPHDRRAARDGDGDDLSDCAARTPQRGHRQKPQEAGGSSAEPPSPSPRRPRALSADRVCGARRQQVARRTSCRRLVFLLLAAHHDQVAPVLRRGPSSGGTSLHIGEPQLAVPVEWDPAFFVGSHLHITFFYGRA